MSGFFHYDDDSEDELGKEIHALYVARGLEDGPYRSGMYSDLTLLCIDADFIRENWDNCPPGETLNEHLIKQAWRS